MFGIPLAAIAGCLAAALTLTALVVVLAIETINQQEDPHGH